MIVLALCVSLYIFDLTPAEVWQWLCAAFGGVHAKGAAMAQQSAARRAERAAARAAEAEAEEDYDPKQKMNTGMRKMPKRRWKLRLSASVCRTG